MPMTLTEVEKSLTLWKRAYNLVSKGGSVSIDGRSLTRADADACWKQILRLSALRDSLQGKGRGFGFHQAGF